MDVKCSIENIINGIVIAMYGARRVVELLGYHSVRGVKCLIIMLFSIPESNKKKMELGLLYFPF